MKMFLKVLAACFVLPLMAHEGYVAKEGRTAVQVLNDNNRTLTNSRRAPADWTPASPRHNLDYLTFAKMQADGVPINATADDGTFLRRTTLLLTGRLPEPDVVRSFHESTSDTKRDDYIETLLASDAFTTYWGFWFQEYFQSTAGMLRGGQQLFNEYLVDAVSTGKNLDVMARELLTHTGLSDEVPEVNFLVRGSGSARYSLDVWDDIAIFASRKFLGVPLDCISCHDGLYHLEEINLYLAERKREELWGMAAHFAGMNKRAGTRREDGQILSINMIENPTAGYLAESDNGDRPIRAGGLITPSYIFDGAATGGSSSTWPSTLADKILADRQFARFWANRLWGHLFGLGMVEPMDSFDLSRIAEGANLPEGWEMQVLDVDLLEHMTDQMITFNFNLRDYLRYVLQSSTFQMDSTWAPGNWQDAWAPYYSRYLAHRMSAEAVFDSLVVATGVTAQITQGYFNGVTIDPANYAHELVDTAHPRRRNQTAIADFLNAFGRGNRNDIPRTNQGDIAQAMHMMNSDVTNNPAFIQSGHIRSYVDAGMSEADIVRELYLDVYSRPATDEEVTAMVTQLANFNSLEEKAQTVLWLLVNMVPFNFIY